MMSLQPQPARAPARFGPIDRVVIVVCVNKEQDHTVQRRSCGRIPGGGRLHDYWQQASKRGAAKECCDFWLCSPGARGSTRL